MKKVLIIAMLFALSGCASLENAGNATYTISPFVLPSGATVCCSLSVKDGKERQSLEASITKTGDDYSITLKENGIAAFKGQKQTADFATSTVEAAATIGASVIAAPAVGVLGSGLKAIAQ